jgi:outer membrane lipoprotein carrier protein
MPKIFIIVFLLCITLSPHALEAEESNVQVIVREIQERYNSITNIKGKFTQDSYIKDLEEEQHFSGEFFIKLPSQLKWIYTEPRNEEVIVNNSLLWIYKKVDNQVIKTQFSEQAYGQAPIALLAGLGDLSSDFTITEVEQDILQLVPKKPMGIIKRILMTTNSYGFPIKSLKLIDAYENEITVTVSDIVVNQPQDDSFFEFTPPPGIEVFEFK